MSTRQLWEKIGAAAYNYEKTYHGCSQCVLAALQEHLQIGNKESFRAASALAGGVARMGEICGALLGGVMAIGLAYGREQLEDGRVSPQYAKAMELAANLYRRFEGELGSTRCWDIQEASLGRSFDLKDPIQREEFVGAGGYEKCSEVAQKAAQLTTKVILEAKN